jgi:sugar phosphate isomerase/epimerase
MRKIGCCLNMLARTPDGIGLENLSVVSKFPFDFIELPMAQLMAVSSAERERAARAVADSGFPCDAVNNFFQARLRLTGPAADHEGALAYAAEALDLTRSFGAGVAVFGSAKARNVPVGFSRERAWDQLISFTRRLGDLAAERGVVVAMEHLNRGESDILTSFSENVRFVREVGHPAVRALADLYHVAMEKEPIENLRQGEGLLVHAHLARLTGRTWPAEPTPELKAFFAALDDIGYEGRVSVEAYSDDLAADCGRALEVLRPLA